jgi:DNA-binding NtrC family response regulator
VSAPVEPAADRATAVLFVDDDRSILRMILRTLRGATFEILTAESASEALALMRQRRVDVVVSDIDMPRVSGIDLLKIVRREFPSALRMLLTGGATLDRALAAINEGEVHRFFTKPFNAELFDATMRDLAERVDKLRRDGEIEARQGRRDELLRWVERVFPGTLDVVRDDRGRIVIEPLLEDLALLDAPPS